MTNSSETHKRQAMYPDGADDLVSEPAGVALTRTAKAEEGAPVDAAQARQLLRQCGCHGCHAIPGVTDPARLLGPPLTGLARRAAIARRLSSDAATLRAWIQHP
jgi:cytochrome c2